MKKVKSVPLFILLLINTNTSLAQDYDTYDNYDGGDYDENYHNDDGGDYPDYCNLEDKTVVGQCHHTNWPVDDDTSNYSTQHKQCCDQGANLFKNQCDVSTSSFAEKIMAP